MTAQKQFATGQTNSGQHNRFVKRGFARGLPDLEELQVARTTLAELGLAQRCRPEGTNRSQPPKLWSAEAVKVKIESLPAGH